jgi:hypothetical protein
VAGIGGFSGKESSVSVEWLEERIKSGAIGWIYAGGSGGSGGGTAGPGGGSSSGGPGGDSRTGSESAIDTVVKSCAAVDARPRTNRPPKLQARNRRRRILGPRIGRLAVERRHPLQMRRFVT